LDEAIEHCRKALEIWPDDPGANNCLGFAQLQKGQVEDAIVHFNTAIEARPDYAPAQNNLGMALYQTGHYEEAVPHFERALATDPDLADAHNDLGAALVQTGHPDEAIVHYERALELKPDYLGAENNLAWVLATSPKASARDGTRAVDLALKANQLAAGNLTLLRTLAAAYAEAGQFQEAIKTAQQALELADNANNAAFASELRREIGLYQAGQAFRDSVPVH
jgi:Flp pilus assembly protein TadD